MIAGGAINSALRLAVALRERGHEIDVAAPVPSDARANLASHPAASMLKALPHAGRTFSSRALASLIFHSIDLQILQQRESLDVLHVHAGSYPYGALLFGVDPARVLRALSVYCPIGGDGGLHSAWWDRPSFARRIFDNVGLLTGPSTNVCGSIAATGTRTAPVRCPMPAGGARQTNTGARGAPSAREAGGSPSLLCIGNTAPDKGLEPLVEAVAILRDRGTTVHLTATLENQSDIPELATREQQIRARVDVLGLADAVTFLGLVPDIGSLYERADLVVVPWRSTRGPSDFPLVAVEAMARRTAVLATPVGGIPELLQHGLLGTLASGVSPDALANAIESALGNSAQRSRAIEAAALAAQEYSSSSIAQDLELRYYETIERANTR